LGEVNVKEGGEGVGGGEEGVFECVCPAIRRGEACEVGVDEWGVCVYVFVGVWVGGEEGMVCLCESGEVWRGEEGGEGLVVEEEGPGFSFFLHFSCVCVCVCVCENVWASLNMYEGEEEKGECIDIFRDGGNMP
jgi:hypothetical protein